MNPLYLVIEGNIGAGKSTLAGMISAQKNYSLLLEEFEDNSFLPKFYQEPERYAFPLEMSFLSSRFNQLKGKLLKDSMFSPSIIADYGFFKNLVFARVTLNDDEFNLYQKMYHIIEEQIKIPEKILYLHNPVSRLLKNIKERARSYEMSIKSDYLEKIEEGYMETFNSLKNETSIIMVDAGQLDFVKSIHDYNFLIKLLDKDLDKGIHRFL